MKNRKYTKEKISVRLYDLGSPEAFVNGKWTKSNLKATGDAGESIYGSTVDIAYGKTAALTFADPYTTVMDDPEMREQAKQLYDYFMEEIKNEGGSLPEEYEQYKNITFEEFIKLLAYGGEVPPEIPKNSLYRVHIGSEYVYFTM